MSTAIVPETMYTDGGSVPQILWGIPGLSPWALGPAYIIHDWIFLVHSIERCLPRIGIGIGIPWLVARQPQLYAIVSSLNDQLMRAE
jgi:hypothetical protein